MKEHYVSRRKRTHKLKLLVSFNGTFCCRPPFRKFGYTGGETRIISVDHNITFSKLKSKIITDLLPPNSAVSASSGFHFSLKYHISASFCGVDGKAGEAPVLILLETDDDVRCMLEEYEAMEFNGEFFTRLWVFVCDPIRHDTHEIYGFFEGRKVFPGIQGIQTLREGEGFLSEDFLTLFAKKTRDSATTDHRSRKFTDNSLMKKVLRLQLLAKKLDEQTEMELTGENGDCEAPLIELCSEPEGPPSFLSKETNFGGNLGRKITDYKHVNPHTTADDESFGKVLPLTRSDSLPLNPKDGNLRLGSDGSKGSGQSGKTFGSGSSRNVQISSEFAAAGQPLKLSNYSGASTMSNGLEANYGFSRVNWASFSYRDRENIMPWGGDSGDTIVKRNDPFPPSGHNQLTGNQNPLRPSQDCVRTQEGYRVDIHNHRFSSSEARSQRTCPYHIKSRALVNEMGNNSNFRFDGSPVGKFYPLLRCSSNISKQRPVLRSYSDASRKTLTNSCHHKGEEVYGKMVCALNNRTKIFDLPYRGQEENPMRTGFHRVIKHERVNPGEGRMAYDGACVRENNRSPIPFDAAVSTVPHAIAVDLLTGPGSEELQIAYQGLSTKTFDEMGTNGEAPLNIGQGMNLSTQEDDIYSCHPNNLSYSSGAELSYNYKYLGTESGQGFNIERSNVHTWDVHAASPADLSMQNLSLATSSKLHLSSPSCAIIDNCQSLLTPDSNDLDLMDEEPLNSAPKVEKSSDISSDSSSDNDARLGKDDEEKQEIHQVVVANLSTEEKDENGKTNKCLKANGALPADIAAFCSLLSTRELQNIRNSDLECIKELGSGTFGTVYYGKWKGTDVAIKRIKRSCFTDDAKEEDRLVADFWKEAHILGQLRHPNIVALYGVATDGPVNSLATVTEYMVNGSLKQVLSKKDRTIDRRKRLIIAMDATCGMEYLHEKNIVHFDLKSHNFLMNMRDPHRPVCKIGDLGLSKIKQRTLVSGGVRGTIPWMAPELLNGNKLVSEKVDVYSFAIVMWELLTGEEPYGEMRSEEIIAGIIRGNLRPEIPSWCEPAWRSLMERCWSSDPDSRPPFSEIAKELRAMAASMNTK